MTTITSRAIGLAILLAAGLTFATPSQALQCVPYARSASGIDLRGDAWKWWNAAAGNYERGHKPKVGAVLVFRKHGHMRLGHVAVVRKLVDPRTMLIDHANWGPRGAGRGTVTKMVPLRDVSPNNDWTEVRVWNPVTRDLGTENYPTYGFIYPRGHHGIEDAALTTEISTDMPAEIEASLADAGLPTAQASKGGAMPIEVGFVFEPGIAMPASPIVAAGYGMVTPVVPAVMDAVESDWDDRAAAQRAGSGRYGQKPTN